jgi:hypothetical protein
MKAKKPGRPPAGIDGAPSSRYPQLCVRVRQDTIDQCGELAASLNLSRWQVVREGNCQVSAPASPEALNAKPLRAPQSHEGFRRSDPRASCDTCSQRQRGERMRSRRPHTRLRTRTQRTIKIEGTSRVCTVTRVLMCSRSSFLPEDHYSPQRDNLRSIRESKCFIYR